MTSFFSEKKERPLTAVSSVYCLKRMVRFFDTAPTERIEFNAALPDAVQQKAAALQMPTDKRDALIFMSDCVVEIYMKHTLDALKEKYLCNQ